MLYQIYEAQRSLIEPFADFAQAAAKLYSNPMSPLGQLPLAERIAAGFELFYRLGKDYEKPTFGITTVEMILKYEAHRMGTMTDTAINLKKPGITIELVPWRRISPVASWW